MLLEASGGFWGLLETSGVRRSRRFDSWSASQSPFRQLECVAVAVSIAGVRRNRRFDSLSASQSVLRKVSACDDDRHFSKTLQFPHALKGHSPAISSRLNAVRFPGRAPRRNGDFEGLRST